LGRDGALSRSRGAPLTCKTSVCVCVCVCVAFLVGQLALILYTRSLLDFSMRDMEHPSVLLMLVTVLPFVYLFV